MQNSHKLKSRQILAEQEGKSEYQIRRYTRLTYLIPEFMLAYISVGKLHSRLQILPNRTLDDYAVNINYRGIVLNIKIFFCIIIRNILNNRLKGYFIVGIFAVFHPFAQKIAEYSSEILVAGVG